MITPFAIDHPPGLGTYYPALHKVTQFARVFVWPMPTYATSPREGGWSQLNTCFRFNFPLSKIFRRFADFIFTAGIVLEFSLCVSRTAVVEVVRFERFYESIP